MAHHVVAAGYRRFVERLNKFPQGALPSELLYRIFALLLSEQDAALLAQLPLRPFTASAAARAWKVSHGEAERLLDGLADRALLLDGEQDGKRMYVLPPPVIGFFEFSMMRVRSATDQRALADLFYQYLNVEDEFVAELFGTETQVGRALVHEPALPGRAGDGAGRLLRDRPHEEGDGAGPADAGSLQVLDHELATEIVRQAEHRAVGLCYCRHKMTHLGRACEAPLEMCLSLDFAADSLARHGHARRIDAAEAVAVIEQAWDLGLVQFAENVRRHPKFICNCCSCCCDALIAARRFAILHPVTTSGFVPEVDAARCNGCGSCAAACPIEAISVGSLDPSGDGRPPKPQVACIDENVCFGCGLCVRACSTAALRLRRSGERVVTPVSTAQRVVMQAIERGTLPYLVFDQQGLAAHRAAAAVLGVILRLPPLQRALASRQLKSRYLERIVDRDHWRY